MKCTLCSFNKRGYYKYHKQGTKILIIDDFPNKTEVKTKLTRHLQGSNQIVFNYLINRANLDSKDFSFATLTQCMPINKSINSKITRDNMRTCAKEKLSLFIKNINPEIIIIQGEGGLRYFFNGGKLHTQRGKMKYWNGYKVLPTYSISNTNKSNKTKLKTIVKDLKYAKKLIKDNDNNLNLNIVETKEDFYNTLNKLKQYKNLGADIETTGTNPYKGDKVFGIGVAIDDFTAYYFPLREHNIIGNGYSLIWNKKEIKALQNFFESNRKFTFHYSNFDIEFLQVQEKWNVNASADSLVLSHLLDENKKEYSLEYLSNKNYMDLVGFKEESKEKMNHSKSFDKMPKEILAKRCCIDSIATLRLTNKYIQELKQDKKLYNYYKRFRKPLLKTFINLQKTGFAIDFKQLNKADKKYTNKLNKLKYKMWKIAGYRFNPRSPDDLRKVLFETLKYTPPKGMVTEKTNVPKTDKKALKAIQKKENSKFINTLIIYKELHKLKSQYIDGLRKAQVKGRVHPVFRISVADTGRSSSQEPNAQNIAGNKDIKNIVTAKKGYSLIEADFSQAEARLFAYLCNSEKLIKASTELDIYTYMASQLYDIKYKDVDKKLRDYCKVITLALLYKMGAASLGKMINKSKNEAKKLYNKFFKEFPKAKTWSQNIENTTIKTGSIRSIFGRKRNVPYINSKDNKIKERAKRQVVNFMVQSPTFDIVSVALRRAEKLLKNYDAQIVLTVHDCVVVECRDNLLNEVAIKLKEIMEIPVKPIPDGLMEVDVEIGKSWGNIKEYEF